jgi:hypothetical protein
MTVSLIQGRFRFGEVRGVEQLTYTRSRGVQPGICQFRIPAVGKPLPTFPTTMTFSDGRNSFTFRDCIIGDVALDTTEGQSWIVSVLDRRWKWQFGEISGHYNVRRADKVILRTAKTPQELAALCFEALGEKRYDVSRMPNQLQPEIHWDMENPAAALEALCTAVGAVVCPRLDDTFAIYPVGVGAVLPKLPGSESKEAIDFAEVPDSIAFAAGPTAWQKSLELFQPVGIEASGKVVPINELSYKPDHGWEYENPNAFASIKDKETRKLAQMSVWKWYQIRMPIKLPFLKAKRRGGSEYEFREVKTVQEILPILDFQVAWETVLGVRQRVKPVVYGLYFDRGDTGRNNATEIIHNLSKNKKLIYKGSFDIDQDYGIVKFSDPMYYLQTTDGKTRIVPAKLYLRTAFNCYNAETNAPTRWTKELKTGYRNGTKPAWIVRDEIFHEFVIEATTGKIVADNDPLVAEQADYYLKAEVAKYQNKNPISAVYTGFPPIDLDGAIAQVTYTIDGEGLTSTEASRDSEHSIVVPSFTERQRLVKLKALLQNADRMMQQQGRGRQGKP